MTMSGPSNPASCGEQVDRMIESDITFGHVEDAIERFEIPLEQKSALWLLAWSRLDSDEQERIAEDAWVAAVSGLVSVTRADPRS